MRVRNAPRPNITNETAIEIGRANAYYPDCATAECGYESQRRAVWKKGDTKWIVNVASQ